MEAPPKTLLAVVHIGPRRARRLVEGLGDEWEAIVDTDPERVFATLRGLGARRARSAAASWIALRTPGVSSADGRGDPRRRGERCGRTVEP
jgi:hypothetical protein